MTDPGIHDPGRGLIDVQPLAGACFEDLLNQLQGPPTLPGRMAIPPLIIDMETRRPVLGKGRAGPPVIGAAAGLVTDELQGLKEPPPIGILADFPELGFANFVQEGIEVFQKVRKKSPPAYTYLGWQRKSPRGDPMLRGACYTSASVCYDLRAAK